jgi:sporulation protein YlmC with PRC-barrel domain
MNSKELIGKEVIDSEARAIGNVKDVEIDLKKWTVSAIVVKTGFIRKRTIQTSDVDKVGDKVVLKVTIDRIQRV